MIAFINLAELTIEFKDATQAEETDLFVAASPDDLNDLTGPQAVALYNVTAKELESAPSEVKRFADKQSASKRLWANLVDLAEQRARLARVEASAKNKPVKVATVKAANNETIPAPRKPARKGGINLPPHPEGAKRVFACREGSKQALLVDMLSRPEGATMEELMRALAEGGNKPWKEVTVKSGLNWDMNKLKGYGIRTTFRNAYESWLAYDFESSLELSLEGFEGHPDDNTDAQKQAILEMNVAKGFDPNKRDIAVYHLVLPADLSAPRPHTPRAQKKSKKTKD